MAMRLSGLMSGLDTDSLIQELVSARKTKVDSVKKTQTKLQWKQDAWKDLNSKLKNLQAKFIGNMRFKSSYMKKTTKVSDSSAVSVITGEDAVNGVQELKVNQLAKTGYLTGGALKGENGKTGSYTAVSKMSDLVVDEDGTKFTGTGSLKISAGSKTVNVNIGENTSISDILTQIKGAGLNANFDAKNQRFFISSKESGASNDFTIEATNAGGELAMKALGLQAGQSTKVDGQDAEIELNGATFTNSNNVFEINGLTFTALRQTAEGESVTVTTQNDTDGIYDMIKSFLKEYNSVISEMDKLYNAASAKGFEPMTNEEKEALSESEVEEYEKKIKDALLRRDESLSSVNSTLREAMSSGYTVNGKTLYLSSFGIDTLGYFEAADNEKNMYHIAGDADDDATSGNADVLKGMIASDPDTVISFFTQLSQNLYTKMSDLSKSVDGYRSFGSFFDDKKMKEDYSDYTTKISEEEKKLNDYEDKWYKKFAQMEKAMAQMQSSANALTGLLGGGNQ